MKYIGKILLLAKEIKNLPLFLYHLYHYANKLVPFYIASSIAKRNRKQQIRDNVGDVYINTYDGSNQVVHPDIAWFGNRIVLVCTPYPYAMEEYENPCLYIGDSLNSLVPIFSPLDQQNQHKQGVHMSDPCVVDYKDRLLCVYRETRYKGDCIFIKSISRDKGGKIIASNRNLLFEQKNIYILSPAVLVDTNQLYVYFVENSGSTFNLVLNTFSSDAYELKNSRKIIIKNEPEDYFLWHIAMSSGPKYSKEIQENTKLKGLFLYVSKNDRQKKKLFFSEADCITSNNWTVIQEISIPTCLQGIIQFPYKSCFNPQNGNVLLSYRDKRQRNRIIELQIV